jgi:dsDNA-specific endonuclease/ATPase MutS2
LDLHTFRPKDVPHLLNDYIAACIEAEIFDLRIIHGKGTGVLRERVHAILKRHPQVVVYTIAPANAGGWGATVVTLKRPDPSSSDRSPR